MDPAPIVTRLWDYGWLCRDSVKLAAAPSDKALLEQYAASPAFHTSFLPSNKDETGIHGPFLADRIKAVDFVPLLETNLEHYLESVHLSESPGDDEAERVKILPHLRGAFGAGCRCYILKPDERNTELFHDWGFVLTVFREFLFVGPQRDSLERFIIGYD
jgi:hypothetical protein